MDTEYLSVDTDAVPRPLFHCRNVQPSQTPNVSICHPEPSVLQRGRKPPREGPMYFVYIMTNRSKTFYIGVTNHLMRRAREHKTGTGSEFTAKYKLDRLVYFERFEDVRNAIEREKRIKG